MLNSLVNSTLSAVSAVKCNGSKVKYNRRILIMKCFFMKQLARLHKHCNVTLSSNPAHSLCGKF
jgi:hypothetical protein